MKDYGRRKDGSRPVAVVVVGEASESEEEEEDSEEQEDIIDHRTVASETIGKNVDTAKQVTDSKSSLLPPMPCSSNRAEDNTLEPPPHQQPQLGASTLSGNKILSTGREKALQLPDSSSSHGLNRAKDSLLHSLLKESNSNLKHNLINLSCTPYAMYSKDVGRITRHMIATQKQLQSGCALLQKAANDTNQLNKSFITLSTVMSLNSKLIEQTAGGHN